MPYSNFVPRLLVLRKFKITVLIALQRAGFPNFRILYVAGRVAPVGRGIRGHPYPFESGKANPPSGKFPKLFYVEIGYNKISLTATIALMVYQFCLQEGQMLR